MSQTATPRSPPKKPSRSAWRSDRDRMQLSRRLEALTIEVQDCPEGFVRNGCNDMLAAHQHFVAAHHALQTARSTTETAQRERQVEHSKSYAMLTYVVRKVRAPADSWHGQPVIGDDVLARRKRLLGDAVPSRHRFSQVELEEMMKHLSFALKKDPKEAGRWDPEFVAAVHVQARRFRQANIRGVKARQDQLLAWNAFKDARARWDYGWDLLERAVMGHFGRYGQADQFAWVFKPVRYRRLRRWRLGLKRRRSRGGR